MKIASVREFNMGASKYLGAHEEVVVTRRGKPVAVLTPVEGSSAGALLLELRGVLTKAKMTKSQVLKILDQARDEVYG